MAAQVCLADKEKKKHMVSRKSLEWQKNINTALSRNLALAVATLF